MEPRQTVTAEELVSFINQELAREHDIRIHGPIFPLRDPDEEGCNWSKDRLNWRLGENREGPTKGDWEVIREARRRFNLKEGE